MKRRGKRSKDNFTIFARMLGLGVGILGVVILYWTPVVILTCRHVETLQVDCLLKQRMLGLIPVGEIPITRLEEAYVNWDTQSSRRSSDNREYDYSVSKVILVSASGELALNDLADPAITIGNSEEIARKINDYLASPPSGEPLTVWQALWLPLLAGSCFGIFLILWLIGFGIELSQKIRSGYSSRKGRS